MNIVHFIRFFFKPFSILLRKRLYEPIQYLQYFLRQKLQPKSYDLPKGVEGRAFLPIRYEQNEEKAIFDPTKELME